MQFKTHRRRLASAIGMVILWAGPGCQSWQKTHEAAVASFGHGHLHEARESLTKSQNAIRSESKLIELDQAILDLAEGKPETAESRFRRLRRELEHLEQKDMTEQASSILTDSRAVAFSGRDFERRMILNMALLSSIFGDGQDSFAYSLQVTQAAHHRKEELAKVQNESRASTLLAGESTAGRSSLNVSTASFQQSKSSEVPPPSPLDETLAFSSYLAAAVQSETPSRHAETDLAIQDIQYWKPGFVSESVPPPGETFGTRCRSGYGTLHVIAFAGKAPRWVSESAEPTSAALLIADRIISMTGKHTLPPTISAVKIAKPESRNNALRPGSLRCTVAQDHEGVSAEQSLTFSTIVNMDEVARASYEQHRDQEIALAISRRVVKKGAIYVLKETQKIHRNSLVDLGVNVAGIAWEAMEKADTRSWRMLPARIDVAYGEFPEGEWTTSLQIQQYGRPGRKISVPVRIVNGRNTFLLCLIPETDFAGQILLGGADKGCIAVNQKHLETTPESNGQSK